MATQWSSFDPSSITLSEEVEAPTPIPEVRHPGLDTCQDGVPAHLFPPTGGS
jgi:hypothetical protein